MKAKIRITTTIERHDGTQVALVTEYPADIGDNPRYANENLSAAQQDALDEHRGLWSVQPADFYAARGGRYYADAHYDAAGRRREVDSGGAEHGEPWATRNEQIFPSSNNKEEPEVDQ